MSSISPAFYIALYYSRIFLFGSRIIIYWSKKGPRPKFFCKSQFFLFWTSFPSISISMESCHNSAGVIPPNHFWLNTHPSCGLSNVISADKNRQSSFNRGYLLSNHGISIANFVESDLLFIHSSTCISLEINEKNR